MSATNPPSLIISPTKTAALSRILDTLPKGYGLWTRGQVAADKASRMIQKFHERFGVACSPAQRTTRKQHGQANAILVVYWPEGADAVEWLMLVTQGSGMESERLHAVDQKPRLAWLGYELVRHTGRGKTIWTWKRPKAQMAELYDVLSAQLNKRHYSLVRDTLQRIANQPGFHGVRQQSWELCQFARSKGYDQELPFLYHLQKVAHGKVVALSHLQKYREPSKTAERPE